MKLSTPAGDDTARYIAAALVRLTELEKTSPLDADALWALLVTHIRSHRPQALLVTPETP